ncbi:hypothetical protein F5Y07DRAFT_70170 [Xylaria sp. FL0933]|nr:hypothetical protein F5Y07DRAFT_70170 [Xylaria sp. FL0933]
MRFSFSAITALLIASSSGPLAPVGASPDAEPKPDTTPDSTPTKTAHVKARETTAQSLLGALYQVANSFGLRGCIPQALPLVTTLPRIPPGLLVGGALSQALSQTSREIGDVCEFSITGSVGATYTSFLPAWYDWYNSYSSRIASVVSKCPKAGALVTTLEAYERCPQVVAVLTAASTAATGTGTDTAATTTGTGTGTGSSSEGDGDGTTAEPSVMTTSTDSPSAAHETGFLGAAAGVAAGLLGVAAVL